MIIITRILTVILIGFPFFIYGQADSTKKKYEYSICVYHKPKGKSIIIKNEYIGIADTTLAFLKGTILDNKKNPIQFAIFHLVSLTNNNKFTSFTDSIGNFELHIPSDNYKLAVFCMGYQNMSIDQLKLGTGEMRKLDIQLADSGVHAIYTIESNKPLNKREIKSRERKIKNSR